MAASIRTPHGDVTSSANFVVLPPALVVSANGAGDVAISWAATAPVVILAATDNLGNP